MRVLVVHNCYQQRGGEDTVVESEVALLRRRGCAVEVYSRSNDEIGESSAVSVAVQTLWSRRTMDDVERLIGVFQPDVIHAHNTFPLISPSLYWIAGHRRVPVVQTLHNFRMLCLNALFLRDGVVCEACSGHVPWRGVTQGCYRGSKSASAVLAAMLVFHRAIGTYGDKVARYIALNEFCRSKFVAGGLPADKIVVKPNFVEDQALPDVQRSGLLFVGRLSAEKGLASLGAAMRLRPDVDLRVVGDGPEAGAVGGLANVQMLGRLDGSAVRSQMGRAMAVVVPSIWHETFGLVVIEAFASGCPVIASRTGALAGLVREGHNGLLFEPGNVADLAEKIGWAHAHPGEMVQMGIRARADYEQGYSPDANFEHLMAVYEDAIQHLGMRGSGNR